MVPSSVRALSLLKTLSSTLADTCAQVSTDSQPTGAGENETLKPQYLLWKIMENSSLVEENSDNTMETVGIIFIKRTSWHTELSRHWKPPWPYLPPLCKEPRIRLQPERNPCPLDPSVTLSLKGPARWSCPPGWNVTKINRNLVHGLASLVAQLVKSLPAMQEIWVWPLGWEDSLEKEKGYPLKYSDLENSTDCIVHGVTKSRTRLSSFHYSPWYYDLDSVFTERRSLPGFY